MSDVRRDRALTEYGLENLDNVPIARYNQYHGHCYAVYRREDLKVAQVNQKVAKEQQLEKEHGGPEGLKRKRADDAMVSKKAATIASMSNLMVELFTKNGTCDGHGLPALDSNMPKAQAKEMFKLTDSDFLPGYGSDTLCDKGPMGRSKSSYSVAGNPLFLYCHRSSSTTYSML